MMIEANQAPRVGCLAAPVYVDARQRRALDLLFRELIELNARPFPDLGSL
jgi:hypothetical protein